MMQLKMMQEQSLDLLITALFANGEKGAWYDPSDLSTLFQNVAGTTPVTEVGQPIGKILDKSGNGRHLVAAADTTVRPTLAVDSNGLYYIAIDGVDDTMSCAGFDMSASDAITVASAINKTADAAFSVVAELSATSVTNNGSFTLFAPSGAAPTIGFSSRGTTTVSATKNAAGAAAGSNHVVLCSADISTPIISTYVDDLAVQSSSSSQGTGNYGNYTLYMFKRGGTLNPFSGRFYGVTIRGSSSTDAEMANLKAYYKAKAGV